MELGNSSFKPFIFFKIPGSILRTRSQAIERSGGFEKLVKIRMDQEKKTHACSSVARLADEGKTPKRKFWVTRSCEIWKKQTDLHRKISQKAIHALELCPTE